MAVRVFDHLFVTQRTAQDARGEPLGEGLLLHELKCFEVSAFRSYDNKTGL